MQMPRLRKTSPNLCCPVCQSTFTRKEHYQRHLRTHTKERPFACTWCGQTFAREDARTRHYTTVHQDASLGGPVTSRRRVVKACITCSQAKVRCDGGQPCERCYKQHGACRYGLSKRVQTVMERLRGSPGTERQTLLQGPNIAEKPVLGDSYPLEIVPEATVNDLDITAPSFLAGDLVDFESWFNIPAYEDDFLMDLTFNEPDFSALDTIRAEESNSQKNSDNSLSSRISELYTQNQLPHIDQDAVEPRQYDPSSADVDAQLIFPDMMNIAPEDIEAENLAHVEEVPDELSGIVLRVANQMQLHSNYPQFTELRIPPARVLNAWVQLYFEHFHPLFPVLHKPTFSPSSANPFLVFAAAAIGAHFSELAGAQSCLWAMHELIRRYTSFACEKWNQNSRELWMVQTILLNQIGLMYSGDRRALELAEVFQAVPVTLGRRKRLFCNTLPQEKLRRLDLSLEEKWQVSTLDEQRRRAGFAIWLIDTAYDLNFDLCTTMRAKELQNCFPPPETSWNASSAQSWATFGENNCIDTNDTLAEVIESNRWVSLWNKTGTLGRQTLLQYLTTVVNDKHDVSPGSPRFSPGEISDAQRALEALFYETENQSHGPSLLETKASTVHRVMIVSALSVCDAPTSDIISQAIKVIYQKMDDNAWCDIIDKWADSRYEGRLGVLYAAHAFDIVRTMHCTHFMTPVLFLKSVLILWMYSFIFDRLHENLEYRLPLPPVVLGMKRLDHRTTSRWMTDGPYCIELPMIGNVLSKNGRCKMLDVSVVIMRSLKAWGISSMYAQLLVRLRAVEDVQAS